MRLPICALCAAVLSCLIPQQSFAQNEFVNLDFETFIPGPNPHDGFLPGWGNVTLLPHASADPLEFLNEGRGAFHIDGVYSYVMASGFETDRDGNIVGGAIDPGISQTGLVPTGTVSLRLFASHPPILPAFSGPDEEYWQVTLGSQQLLLIEVGPSEYGANLPANFAGTLKTLSIQTSSFFISFNPIIAFDNITFSSQPVEFPTRLGDANLDGVVDFADIPGFIAVLISGDYQREADCDQNEVVNFADIPAFIDILVSQ